MALKKAVVLFSVFLVLLGLMDFTNRLTLTSVSNMQQNEMVDQGSKPVELNHIMLDEAAVKALLSWSDIKAVTLLPEPIQLPPPVVEPKPEALDQRQDQQDAQAQDSHPRRPLGVLHGRVRAAGAHRLWVRRHRRRHDTQPANAEAAGRRPAPERPQSAVAALQHAQPSRRGTVMLQAA